MALETRVEGDAVYLRGQLDLPVVDHFVAAAETALGDGDRLVVDLSELTFIDSSGLRGVLTIALKARSPEVVLRNPRDQVRKVLEMTRLPGRVGIRVEDD